jgi:hypothetical protein
MFTQTYFLRNVPTRSLILPKAPGIENPDNWDQLPAACLAAGTLKTCWLSGLRWVAEM